MKNSGSNFRSAITGKEKISVIAEIKRRSPSHGDFPNIPVQKLVEDYIGGGASAISVVTEAKRFNGSISIIEEATKHMATIGKNLPIIRKDFISNKSQIEETAKCGASAILLIAKYLEKKQLAELIDTALGLGLDPVVEIHSIEDLNCVPLNFNITIGVNNRDLDSLKTDVNHAKSLLDNIDPRFTIIAESAFKKPEELKQYFGKIDAVLIGTAFLTASDPKASLISFTSYVSRT